MEHEIRRRALHHAHRAYLGTRKDDKIVVALFTPISRF